MTKEQEELVSVILPVYNGSKNISKAIESILRQTYVNLELILVDDCSTDNTLEILKQYKINDKRIKIICNEVNLKLPQSLNVGFSHAAGYYLTWTSDDNLYKENAIECMVNALNLNPNIDMVYANYTNIDADGNEIGKAFLLQPEHMYKGNVIGACFMYTRNIAAVVGEYDPALFLAEDYDYWLRIWKYGKILHIDENLYYYRRHADSLSETKKAQIGVQTYRTLEKNFLFINSVLSKNTYRYEFYDFMLQSLEKNIDERNRVRKALLKIDCKYWLYKKKKSTEYWLVNSVIGDTIRKIKMRNK